MTTNGRRRPTPAAAPDRHLLSRLAESSRDAFLTTDPNGLVTAANDAASALLAIRPRTLLEKPLERFVDVPDRPAFRQALARASAAPVQALELTIRPRRGEPVAARADAAPDASGGISWIVAPAQAVPVATVLAATGRDQVRNALDGLADGMIFVDSDAKVHYANAAATTMLGAPVRRGRRLPADWEGVGLRALVSDALAPGAAAADRLVTTTAGRTYAVRALPDRAGTGAVIVLSDASANVRRDRAEKEFVANAAHELRTPVAAILGAVEVLQDGAKEAPDVRDRFLAHIEAQCRRLQRLAAALLTLARAESAVEPPRVDVVDLCRLLEAVAHELRPAKGVEVRVECAPNLAVFVNRDLVEQAIANLATNSARHTREGTIRLSAVEVENGAVSVEITDTGPGMAADTRSRALERFHRGPDGDGFGLGLAIATQSLRAIGAALVLESAPGLGTRARVTLPAGRLVER